MIAPASLEEIASAVAGAARNERPLRIVGRGSWLDAGGAVQAADSLSLASYSGIVNYVPGDLTITVHAGTTLTEIATATGTHGQWLPLDPAGRGDGTIGATVSTGSYGPLASAFGRPRDQVLGIEFVSGTGEIITVGSRVVKNVAGFDLTRLIVGSWGTLGVITQITLRLRARSDVERSAAIVLPERGRNLSAALSAVRAARIAPLALELLSGDVANALGIARETILLARFGGNEASVNAQLVELAKLGASVVVPEDCWEKLRAMDGNASATLRFATPLADLSLAWDAIGDAAEGAQVLRHATVMRGVVRVLVNAPGAADDAAGDVLTSIARPVESARLIPERVGGAWSRFAPYVGDPISRRVKQAFDPRNVLNPGILGPSQ